MQDPDTPEQGVRRPWIALNNSYDVEAWIDSYNRDLRQVVDDPRALGYGICFHLAAGGDIFMHTTSEGEVLLDVTPDAQWVTPVIAAATRIDPPPGQIWHLPGHTLTQLVLGLSGLIGASSLVARHDFRQKKY